jgi:hypothetical protein
MTTHPSTHAGSAGITRQTLLALGLCLVFLLPACAPSEKFTRLRVSDYRGETLAEYTARGGIRPVEGGYRIMAVERISGHPYPTLSKYPLGWHAVVLGPRVSHWRVEKPAWLAEREQDD